MGGSKRLTSVNESLVSPSIRIARSITSVSLTNQVDVTDGDSSYFLEYVAITRRNVADSTFSNGRLSERDPTI